LPTADEVRQFLADTDSNKRDKLVAALLERPAYADYWATKWAICFGPITCGLA